MWQPHPSQPSWQAGAGPQQPPWHAGPHQPGRAGPSWAPPGPAFGQEPPKRNNTGLVVGIVLAAVTVFGIGTVGAVAASVSADKADEQSAPAAPSYAPVATSTSETSSETTTSEQTTTSSEDEVSTGRPILKLGDNPINIEGNGAVTTPCSLPEFATDLASQDAFYQAALPCLVQAWEPALEEADLPTDTPHVVTTGSDVTTPCGLRTWDQTALYCPQDNTIYMTARYYSEVEGRTEAGVFLGQFAHEFGHALQRLSGINAAYGQASAEAGGDAGLELTRRSELQATCFEGMTLAALQNGGVSNEIIFPALRDSAGRGDENSDVDDHGSIETNSTWIQQGFTKNRVSQCNTWLSPAADVD
ncbi:neutral zinc metallopeptidase [Saccharopolyspora rhizosphaerae]|uniref:neutral zinc metallopeptidase n=1 Tax=Saccharopolyspora rhizosphaerae TaxID=2492662 RepID=UPI001F2AA7CB|nr:neutral zinc metallopeptidase [Saccharopolyspora rhizosphaerae]